MANISCPGFQVGSDGTCWQGVGMGCYAGVSWNKTWQPTLAKRFQRGQVRVIKEMKGVQIMGLQKVFDTLNMGLMPDPIAQCKKYCYSVLRCQYWQLDNQTGCWVELPDVQTVQYPLTTAGVHYNSSHAPYMIAGEYIQRTCLPTPTSPPAPVSIPPLVAAPLAATATTTTTTGAAGGFPWWGWLLLALLLCCCLGLAGAAVFLLGGFRKQKPKKTRSAPRKTRTAPAAAPPPVVPSVAVPGSFSRAASRSPPVTTVHTLMPMYSAPAPFITVERAPVRFTPMAQQAVPLLAQPPAPLAPMVVTAPQQMQTYNGLILLA